MSSQTKDSQQRVTDNIYELNYFNSNGLINTQKTKTHLVLIFFGIFLVSSLSLFAIGYTINNDVPISNTLCFEFFNTVLENYITFYTNSFIKYFTNNMLIAEFLINQIIISFSLAILVITIYYYFKILKPSKFQGALSSAGLSQYYFYKKKKQEIYLKFKKGQKNAYKEFLSQNENLAQMLGYQNILFKRWNSNGVMMQYSNSFPTLKELSNLKVENFLKPNYLFLGIGLPLIGEKYNKKDLVNKKYLARYLEFSDIPVGTGNLGSAGGGKSNTMNQYLYSIFYNFDKIEKFYFIDFKGGIEAQPILDLENRYKTSKIQIFDDNRIELYKTLKLLYFINKARMRYLRFTKKKKFISDFIVLLFDELAEILDFTATTKEDKFIQEKITFYIESLLRTGRSQGFKIIYSTQSYLSTASGLTSGMKNNTKLKVAHQLGSKLQVGSIKPVEELEELCINPTNYDIGKNVVINESNNSIYEVRSLYVPDNFIETVQIKNKVNNTLKNELKQFYKEVYQEMKSDLEQSGASDDTIFTLEDIAKELGIAVSNSIEVVSNNTTIKKSTSNNNKTEQKPITKKPKLNIAKTIQSKKIQKASKSQVNKLLNTKKLKDKHSAIFNDKQISNLKQELKNTTSKSIPNTKTKQDIDNFLASLK